MDRLLSEQDVINTIKIWFDEPISTKFKNSKDLEQYVYDSLFEKIKAIPSAEQEPAYCDRNICLKNEYNGIGCEECEVTKSQEPKTDVLNKIRAELMLIEGMEDAIEIIDRYRERSE